MRTKHGFLSMYLLKCDWAQVLKLFFFFYFWIYFKCRTYFKKKSIPAWKHLLTICCGRHRVLNVVNRVVFTPHSDSLKVGAISTTNYRWDTEVKQFTYCCPACTSYRSRLWVQVCWLHRWLSPSKVQDPPSEKIHITEDTRLNLDSWVCLLATCAGLKKSLASVPEFLFSKIGYYLLYRDEMRTPTLWGECLFS